MHNTIKTFLLLGILSVILIVLGGAIGGRDGVMTAFIISLAMNVGMYLFSDKIALSMSRAVPMDKIRYKRIYRIVEELSKTISIPMPDLYMTPDKQANAFATGRGPGHASVAVTQGILDTLTDEQLRAVLAHELSHVKNRDVLVATVAAVLASTISFVANMSLYGAYGRDEDDNRGGGILGILFAVFVPLAASLIQMAISRQREFAADETGAKTIGGGMPLANALLAIHASTRRFPARINPALASLYIDNPTGALGHRLMHLFSTHPPVEERVKRLKLLSGYAL